MEQPKMISLPLPNKRIRNQVLEAIASAKELGFFGPSLAREYARGYIEKLSGVVFTAESIEELMREDLRIKEDREKEYMKTILRQRSV